MRRIDLRTEWILEQAAGGEYRLQPLLDLLGAIAVEGSILLACAQLAISYRYAWGLVRDGAALLGGPLVHSRRGRRSELTPLGEKLLWAHKRVVERLAPAMTTFVSELETDLRQAGDRPAAPLRVHAGDVFAVNVLLQLIRERHVAYDVRHGNGLDALSALARGACDVAGFHVPLGALEAQALAPYARWLDPRRHVLIHVVVRHQGLIVARGNPLGLISLGDLLSPGIRFINREPGSGTRMLLNLLLRTGGIDGSRIAGFETVEHTHGAVAAHVGSGMADAGFGVETAARLFKLGFAPLVNERYFLACDRRALDTPALRKLLAIVRSTEFRLRLSEVAGVDSIDCGTVQDITEVFPTFLTSGKGRLTRPA